MRPMLVTLAIAALLAGRADGQRPEPPAPAVPTPSAPAAGPIAAAAPPQAGYPSSAEQRVQALQLQLAALTERLSLLESRYKAGVATVDELSTVRSQLSAVQQQYSVQKQALELQQTLSMPVTVELRDASVPSITRTLTDVLKVPIQADPSVSDRKRLTLTARRVPLADVMAQIATQTHLAIERQGNGFLLKPWPTMMVNGQAVEVVGPNAPWSSELAPFVPDAAPGAMAFNGGMASPPFGADARIDVAGPATITALGAGSFVVSQPGTGPKGERGLLLTVYQVVNGTLRKTASGFHALQAGPPAGGTGGYGGGFGGGAAGYGGGRAGAGGYAPSAGRW